MSRIYLRKLRITDLPRFYAYRRDTDVSKWTSKPVKAGKLGRLERSLGRLFQVLSMIAANIMRIKKTKVYRYAIVLNDGDLMIGVVSITMLSKDRTIADIGYWLGKKYWGKGLMTEALSLATETAFFDLKIERLTAWTYNSNISSKKVLEKCGFTLHKQLANVYLVDGQSYDRLEYMLKSSDRKVVDKVQNDSF